MTKINESLKAFDLHINGVGRPAGSGATIVSVNPARGEAGATYADASEVDVGEAVAAAVAAFTEGPWPRLSATERGHLLMRLAASS